jgi:methionyl-tRNA formyltransferase
LKPLSIIFAGTPEFSVPALNSLVAAGHRIVAVYTQPDRPAGRGQQVSMSAVKQAALERGLPVEQPPTLRNAGAVDRLASLRADLMVVVAYGLILPQAVLDVPPMGCINIHGSLLPRWRGAAPIHRAILAGDAQTGITIMQMDAGLDTGPTLLERPTAIEAHETSGTLHDRLAAIGAQAVVDAIEGLTNGDIEPRPQPEDGATYAAKIRKEEAVVDWRKSALELDRQVRAFNPWPVAQTQWEGQQLRIWQANALGKNSTNAPGTVLHGDSSGIQVATGEGVLNVTRVQLAGRKAVSAAEFLNAHRIGGAVLT